MLGTICSSSSSRQSDVGSDAGSAVGRTRATTCGKYSRIIIITK